MLKTTELANESKFQIGNQGESLYQILDQYFCLKLQFYQAM